MEQQQALQEQLQQTLKALAEQPIAATKWASICEQFFDDGRDRPRTPFFPGTVQPARVGWYERAPFARLERHYWDGAQWLGPDGKPWVNGTPQVQPCWRGLPDAPV